MFTPGHSRCKREGGAERAAVAEGRGDIFSLIFLQVRVVRIMDFMLQTLSDGTSVADACYTFKNSWTSSQGALALSFTLPPP